jgi:hypothetical protein
LPIKLKESRGKLVVVGEAGRRGESFAAMVGRRAWDLVAEGALTAALLERQTSIMVLVQDVKQLANTARQLNVRVVLKEGCEKGIEGAFLHAWHVLAGLSLLLEISRIDKVVEENGNDDLEEGEGDDKDKRAEK